MLPLIGMLISAMPTKLAWVTYSSPASLACDTTPTFPIQRALFNHCGTTPTSCHPPRTHCVLPPLNLSTLNPLTPLSPTNTFLTRTFATTSQIIGKSLLLQITNPPLQTAGHTDQPLLQTVRYRLATKATANQQRLEVAARQSATPPPSLTI